MIIGKERSSFKFRQTRKSGLFLAFISRLTKKKFIIKVEQIVILKNSSQKEVWDGKEKIT